MNNQRYITNVSTLKLNTEKCNGCRICILVCPHEVFDIRNGKSFIKDIDACMECGACAINCSENAIEVKAGVGCAAAVINGLLKKQNDCSCCCIENDKNSGTSCC